MNNPETFIQSAISLTDWVKQENINIADINRVIDDYLSWIKYKRNFYSQHVSPELLKNVFHFSEFRIFQYPNLYLLRTNKGQVIHYDFTKRVFEALGKNLISCRAITLDDFIRVSQLAEIELEMKEK